MSSEDFLSEYHELSSSAKECIRKQSYEGFQRDIRDDLSLKDKDIMENIRIIMDILETPSSTVFTKGSYPAFLEGIASNYPYIEIFIDCEINSAPDSPFFPEHKLKENMVTCKIKDISRPYHTGYRFLSGMSKFQFKQAITFLNEKTLVLQFVVALDWDYNICNRAKNIFRILKMCDNSIHRVALPANSEKLFRSHSCKQIDGIRMKNEDNISIVCYGNPFNLVWQCSKVLTILPIVHY